MKNKIFYFFRKFYFRAGINEFHFHVQIGCLSDMHMLLTNATHISLFAAFRVPLVVHLVQSVIIHRVTHAYARLLSNIHAYATVCMKTNCARCTMGIRCYKRNVYFQFIRSFSYIKVFEPNTSIN